MNVGATKQTYNNQSFEVYMFIYNSDISLSAPDLINRDNSILVPTDEILYMMFENSMDGWVPKAEFEIQDDAHALSNSLKAQNCRIHVSIEKSGGDEMVKFSLTFIVKDYHVIEATQERTTYKIYCELDNAIPLNTICEYATSCDLIVDNEQPENPYKIARNILIQTGYKLYPLTRRNDKGQEVPTRYDLPYTNEYLHFISYPNMRTVDALYYLFGHGVGENGMNPPAYLIHNLLDDKGYITTLENCFDELAIKEQPKSLAIPFSITQSIIPSRQYTMFDTDTISTNGGINNAQLFFNYRFMEYDQEHRQWEDYSINKLVLNDLLTRGIIDSQEKSIYLKMLKEDISQSKYYKYPPHQHEILYDVMRNLELYSSNIQFTVDGDLRFDVGQVINIYEKGQNDSKVEQFNGRWLICKLRHSFRNKEYRTNMICCRRFSQKYTVTADKK